MAQDIADSTNRGDRSNAPPKVQPDQSGKESREKTTKESGSEHSPDYKNSSNREASDSSRSDMSDRV